jgi:hypothetical protein
MFYFILFPFTTSLTIDLSKINRPKRGRWFSS